MAGKQKENKEIIEYCFKIWRANNRDFSKSERQIKKEDIYSVTRTTLSRWCEKYGWKERANELDLKEEKAEQLETVLLQDLKQVHDKLMTYLNNQEIGEVDTAKINSLISNAKQIADLTAKIRKNKLEAVSDEDKEAVQFNFKGV